ncbi:hypothetical protein LTS10_003557 [Elasticomyces elasticus]|nr:hypothetical protein LTS10_003557 [Elasticomyces elasticus]
MADTGPPATPDRTKPRHFLLSNGERVVYAPTKDEHEDASLNFVGKKLNWITDYWMMDKSFPRIMQELEGNENRLSPTTEDQPTAHYKLRGSTRNGLYVLADEGKPPPTREQRDPYDVDLTICREFVLDNGEHVLYTGGSEHFRRLHQDSEFLGKAVTFHPTSGAQTKTPRIVQELKGSEKSTVLSKDGPTESDPTIPYIMEGAPTSRLSTSPYTSPNALAKAYAEHTDASNAENERLYAVISKNPDILTCKKFLLHNGRRVIYVPKTTSIANAHKKKSFEGLDVWWNPDHETIGQKRAFIVRELEASERSTVVSPNGPSDDFPTAPYILAGTINGGLYTLTPRFPAQPQAPVALEVTSTGPLGHADIGRLFPVVSTTSISAEVEYSSSLIHLQRLTDYVAPVQGSTAPIQYRLYGRLDELPCACREPFRKVRRRVQPGREHNKYLFPFQNQSPHKLRQETGSDVNFEYFIILDAKSLEDGTILIVEAIRTDEDDDEGVATAEEEDNPQALRILTLRVEMQLVDLQSLFYDVEGTMREDTERLEEEGSEDGVLRE